MFDHNSEEYLSTLEVAFDKINKELYNLLNLRRGNDVLHIFSQIGDSLTLPRPRCEVKEPHSNLRSRKTNIGRNLRPTHI